MTRVQSVDDKVVFLFVSDATAHHSEWLESVSPLIDMGVMLLIFTIYQVVSSYCDVQLTLLVTKSLT